MHFWDDSESGVGLSDAARPADSHARVAVTLNLLLKFPYTTPDYDTITYRRSSASKVSLPSVSLLFSIPNFQITTFLP